LDSSKLFSDHPGSANSRKRIVPSGGGSDKILPDLLHLLVVQNVQEILK
jgi:hypothetical protein